MLRTAPLLAALAAVPLLAARPPAAPAAPAPPGPGAVLAMHERLFAALDRGDAEAVAGALAPDETVGGLERRAHVFLDGPHPRAARGAAEARTVLAHWPKLWRSDRAEVTTTIVRHQTECASGDLSYGVLEVERAYERGGARLVDRLHVTSLVAYRDGSWKLFHVHVSPVALAEPAAAASKRR
jgi:hypothetical protein